MNRVFYLLPALLLGIICSCSDHDDIQPETTSLTLNLTAAFGHDVENTRKNAMAFDVEKEDGYVGRIKSVDINVEQTDWKTIFFLRKKGTPSTLYNFEATWSATQGADRYIDMRIVNKPVTINGVSGNLPDGSYELMAVGGGGKLKDGKVSFAYDEDIEKGYVGENNNKIRVPYTSKWTDVTVKNGNIVGSLDMEVQGVLMCINIGNYITQEIPIENLTITTTNISPDGYFDPTKEDDNGYPKWERYKIEGTTDSYHTVFTHRVGQTLPEAPGNNERAGETIYTYFWGMPVEGHEIITTRTNDVGNMTSSLRISADDYKVKRFNQKIDEANASNTFSYISARNGFKLVSGTFVRVEMDVLRFKTPLEYVGGYNVSPRAKELCTVNSSFTSGYYNTPIVLDDYLKFIPDGYRVPSPDDWYAIVTTDPSVTLKFDVANSNTLTTNENLSLNGEQNNFYCEYFKHKISSEKTIIYALRFKKSSSGSVKWPAMPNNNKLTAFRYELLKESTSDNPKGWTAKITARFLGESGADVKLQDISNSDYWSKGFSGDKIVELPLCGFCDKNDNPNPNPEIDANGDNAENVKGIYGITPGAFSRAQYLTTKGEGNYKTLSIVPGVGFSVIPALISTELVVIRPFLNNLE
jgi:hypothetical protein